MLSPEGLRIRAGCHRRPAVQAPLHVGEIAWAPEDRPDEAQIEAVLDDFEELAFAGLSPDRCCWSAVLHREADGCVHVLAARCDLQTGRSLNIAPPGWLNDYRPLRAGLVSLG